MIEQGRKKEHRGGGAETLNPLQTEDRGRSNSYRNVKTSQNHLHCVTVTKCEMDDLN